MRDQWCDPSSDELRGYPPLRNPEIDDHMDDECEDNHEEYLERPYTISSIFFCYAHEPECQEEKCHPEYDRFTEDLDELSIIWSHESSCPDEEIRIGLEEVCYHNLILCFIGAL